MSKKKYIIAITSLSLVIVALLGVVAAIWAATSTTVSSKLYVSYTPTKDVIASVSAEYATAGGSAVSIGSQSWSYGQETSTSTSLDKTNLTLTDTNDYIIFHFTFTNNAESSGTGNTQSRYLQIKETSSPAVSNMTPDKKYVTAANAIAAPMTSAKFDSATDGGVALLKNIDYGTTIHIYVRVKITTKGKPASWGSTSANSFSFALTAGPSKVS